MTSVNNGYGGRPASGVERARQNREMKARLAQEAADRDTERERSRNSGIEYDRRERERFNALGLDDIIEVPCIENGVKVMRRFHEKGGQLREVTR